MSDDDKYFKENKKLFKDAIPNPEDDAHRKLTVTTLSTVQPAVFLRLGVFVPTKRKGTTVAPIDVSEDLTQLEFAKKEGYENVIISGPRLNLSTDFKVWMGIIHSFAHSEDALSGNKIRLPFTVFAKNCQYNSKRFDARLRRDIRDSLTRIRGKTLTFSRKDNKKVHVTGLLKTATFDIEENIVELEADESLWELYSEEYLTLLRKKPINALPRKEVAQAIYAYFASLPAVPIPVSFKRLRDRLMLPSSIGEQNRVIKNALEDLQKIGYLEYSLVTKSDMTYVMIHQRSPTLKTTLNFSDPDIPDATS